MVVASLNTRVAFNTSPRTGSGSGVKVSPTPRSSGAGDPDLPSVPPIEQCLPGLLKGLPPALRSLPASQGQFWACPCREGGLGLITIGRSKPWASMFMPQGRGSTQARPMGVRQVSGEQPHACGWGCGQQSSSSTGPIGSEQSVFSDALGTTCHSEDVPM